MLYPLSYSREGAQCIKGRGDPADDGREGVGLLHACAQARGSGIQGTLYRSRRPILSPVGTSPW